MKSPNLDSSVTSSCAVLVPSCDAYSDLWTPFFTLFWKYWNDCPFTVYLGTNERAFQDSRVTVINAGHGSNWSNRVREQLEAIESPYVLLCLEDFFFRRPVPTSRVVEALNTLLRLNGHMVRLVRRPGPDKSLNAAPELGTIDLGAPYRVSTQTAIWRKETLLALMRPDESIWQFEIDGSRRSSSYPGGFFCVWRDAMTYGHHVVERGKWFRKEARQFAKARIGCDFNARPTMTRAETLRWTSSKVGGMLLNLLPWRERLQLTKALRSVDRFGLARQKGKAL